MTNATYIQVGSSCLKDFLGVDPSVFCAQAEILMSLDSLMSSAEDESFGSGERGGYYSISSYLPYVACSIRQDGWLSRGAAYEQGKMGQATADLAISHGIDATPQTSNPYLPNERDYSLAAATIEFCEEHFANCNIDALSDYENSLRVAMASGIVHPKFTGLIASAIKFYQKDVEHRAKNENWAKMVKNSKFQGSIKERKVFENLKVLAYRTWQSDFGCTHFYSFVDENGNAFAYFASRDMNLEVGQVVSLRATVKKHEMFTPKFDNAPTYAQTILTRCALVARATVESSEVVEKVETKYIAPTKEEMDAFYAMPYDKRLSPEVSLPKTKSVDTKVKYHHYHLVGADGRKFILISKSKKKDLQAGMVAFVEYSVEDLSNLNGGERPVSLVGVVQ